MPNFRQSCSSHPPLSKTPPNIQQIDFLHMENLTWRKKNLGTMAGTTVLYTQYPARVTTNPNPNPYPNPNPNPNPNSNPNPSPLNQTNWQDLTMVIPDVLSERQKRTKVSLMTIVICNHITNLKQQPRRRHRKRNKLLTQDQRDNGLKWMDGLIFLFFNLIFIFRSLDIL
jgi:hypothetical protein